jgi:hypothetical protein
MEVRDDFQPVLPSRFSEFLPWEKNSKPARFQNYHHGDKTQKPPDSAAHGPNHAVFVLAHALQARSLQQFPELTDGDDAEFGECCGEWRTDALMLPELFGGEGNARPDDAGNGDHDAIALEGSETGELLLERRNLRRQGQGA